MALSTFGRLRVPFALAVSDRRARIRLYPLRSKPFGSFSAVLFYRANSEPARINEKIIGDGFFCSD
jgi:hypothetical protein